MAETRTYIKKINGHYLRDEEALQRANDAYDLASGKNNAFVYDDFDGMTAALLAANNTAFKEGNKLLTRAVGVPDFWISKVNTTKTETATGSGTKEGDYYPKYNVGFYEICMGEANTVNLDNLKISQIDVNPLDGRESNMEQPIAMLADLQYGFGSDMKQSPIYSHEAFTYNSKNKTMKVNGVEFGMKYDSSTEELTIQLSTLS